MVSHAQEVSEQNQMLFIFPSGAETTGGIGARELLIGSEDGVHALDYV